MSVHHPETSAAPRNPPSPDSATSDRIAAAIARAEAAENARLSASEQQCAVVKQLVWEVAPLGKWAEGAAHSRVSGRYIVRNETGEWQYNRTDYKSLDDAKAAAQLDWSYRILSSIVMRPEAEVRAEAWAAAIEAAAEFLDGDDSSLMSRHMMAQAVRAMSADDASAALDRIKAEAKAEGMREAARIAKSRAGSPDYEPPSPYDRGYAAAVAAVERAILSAIPEVRK